jgi:steroid 5-alpha reductase family enzyme
LIAHLALNATVSAACFVALWLVALRLKDVSFIDSWWALGIGVVALLAYAEADVHGDRGKVLLVLTEAWAIRLGLYLLWRWRHNGPDARYTRLLARIPMDFAWATLIYVFGLQFALQFVVSLPVQYGQWGDPNVDALAIVGAIVAVLGYALESVADWQLLKFKAAPANAGKVMDRGVWRYSRHPNHFGDACVWWGLFLLSGAWWTLPAPLLLTFLLTRFSGVPTVEGRMRRRPGYDTYVARTPAFVPWWPKRG